MRPANRGTRVVQLTTVNSHVSVARPPALLQDRDAAHTGRGGVGTRCTRGLLPSAHSQRAARRRTLARRTCGGAQLVAADLAYARRLTARAAPGRCVARQALLRCGARSGARRRLPCSSAPLLLVATEKQVRPLRRCVWSPRLFRRPRLWGPRCRARRALGPVRRAARRASQRGCTPLLQRARCRVGPPARCSFPLSNVP